tara:strand:+ start:41 stop:661 length:621 start_codon:yes stop_codon:yes gene_type:complete
MQVTDRKNGTDPAPSRVTAVVLAAGRSTRMAPVNKLTADYQGAALVRHAAEAALASRAAEVIVVVGNEAEAVREVLSGMDVRIVANPDYATGLASSVKAGIAAVGPDAAGVVILLGDMPGVTGDVVDALIGAFEKTGGGKICQPRYDGRPGNPVLWPRALFPEFDALSGDIGAKPLLARHKSDVLGVDVATDAIHMDIDAPADLGI